MKKVLALALFAAAGTANAGNITAFYGGDLDGRNGLADEFNTVVSDAYVFDDFRWNGGTVCQLFGNYLSDLTQVAGFQYEIRSGLGLGNGGTLVASGDTNGARTWAPTGRTAFGFREYNLNADVPDFNLPAGTYHLGIRPKGNGSGRAFMSTTSGANSVGGPIGNGNAFFQSTFFGVNYGRVEDQLGTGPWDFSQGVRTIPAPGAAALLGLGALAAGRRRR